MWYETSIMSHNFIPNEYWAANKLAMQEQYIPNSETYVAEINELIVGFVSLKDDYIAAIFVNSQNQGRGIGKLLLNNLKLLHNKLWLKVYSKNQKSIAFYMKNGFTKYSESNDECTGENELLMEWRKLN